ncbi:DNA topoisomerase I [archaeon]|nr:DNA topoisomerase I [archaeon]
MANLIITEKPSSSVKIANALADSKPVRKKHKGGFYYQLTHGGEEILIASCVGHLYGLSEKGKRTYEYPIYDIEWKPSYLMSKDLNYTKDYLDTISALAESADEVIIACDFDVEGEVIGLNAMRFACGRKDASRMKFSTLTKKDLVESYATRSETIAWGQAKAGVTRHRLDWFYGINLSRALMAAVKAAGSFKVLSTGRVQGPALKILTDRELEIQAFVPVPYWEVQLDGNYSGEVVQAMHMAGKIFDEKEKTRIMTIVAAEKSATVASVDTTQRKQAAPNPFNLTNLQTESYKLFKITPKRTLEIAQKLYVNGWTSYPRTSSQQLDPKLGFKNILTQLSKQTKYKELASELLKIKDLKPNNGKKTDPAHPAIYPTGTFPDKELHDRERKVYDLVVKRFFATFAEAATRETQTVELDVKKEMFATKGTRTVELGWHKFYAPYVRLEEVTLPKMEKGKTVDVSEILALDKETQPPKRYNQSSIIKELEKRNLGTKATRADILDRLFLRGYIEGVQITATELGIGTVKLLEKHAAIIVDEKLTADIESEMGDIRNAKTQSEGDSAENKILENAKKLLNKLFVEFKKKEKKVGEEIIGSIKATRFVASKQRSLGKDPKSGKEIIVRIGKFGPLAQIGKKDETTGEVPKFAAIPQTINIDDITLEEALALFTMPRVLGKDPETSEEVRVNIGRFGPYVQYGPKLYASVPKEDDPYVIDFKRAMEIVALKKKADAEKTITVFEKEGIKILKGRYGPYVTDGKKNVTVPKTVEPSTLTVEVCLEMIKNAPAKKKWGKKKKVTKKKSTSKKKKTVKKK